MWYNRIRLCLMHESQLLLLSHDVAWICTYFRKSGQATIQQLMPVWKLNFGTVFLAYYHYFHFVPGFPILGVEWQKMENPDLRLSMGMKPDQKGVRIRRIDPTAPESMLLMPSDVLLSFDGVDIANDGTGWNANCACFHMLFAVNLSHRSLDIKL